MLFEQIKKMKTQLPDCLSVSIVDLEQGLALISIGTLDNSQGADAFHTQLFGMVKGALIEMGTDDEIESIVIESRSAKFISSPIGKTGYFIHLIVKRSTTLGFVHAILRKNIKSLEESVEAFF